MNTGRAPAPIVISGISDTNIVTDILDSAGVWAVCYRGKPISLRTTDFEGRTRYPKSFFPHRGSALRIARELNYKFDTDLFSTRKLT